VLKDLCYRRQLFCIWFATFISTRVGWVEFWFLIVKQVHTFFLVVPKINRLVLSECLYHKSADKSEILTGVNVMPKNILVKDKNPETRGNMKTV